MRGHKSRGQSMVEFALLSGLLFLLVMGIFDFGRAIAVYINIAEAAHEGARQLILRSNYTSTPPDKVIIDATLAKIGGGGMVLTEDPCLANPTPCATPSTPTTPNTGYIWLTPPPPPNWPTPQPPGTPCAYCRTTGNHEVTVRVTYLFAPMTGLISSVVGAQFVMSAGSSMRSEY
ncbi:MAG TPA: TadE family protein [Candidatus Dormibacteraeota bacterium]|nr:TadE family protein [Candidatus Dormibacteraeota bacterium]